MLERDRERDEELEKAKEKYERVEKNFMSQIAELEVMITASNIHSPNFSDKASCPAVEEKQEVEEEMKRKHKPGSTKVLVLENRNNDNVDEDGCVVIDDPSLGKKVK